MFIFGYVHSCVLFVNTVATIVPDCIIVYDIDQTISSFLLYICSLSLFILMNGLCYLNLCLLLLLLMLIVSSNCFIIGHFHLT